MSSIVEDATKMISNLRKLELCHWYNLFQKLKTLSKKTLSLINSLILQKNQTQPFENETA